METTTITNWLTGTDVLSPEPTLVRDGIWAVKSWRYMQQAPKADSHWPFMALAVAVMVAFLLPVLAWSVEVPVLKSSLRRGNIISASDLTMRDMKEKAIPPQALRQQKELIGQEVFRPIRAGVPIYNSYVRTPPTVRKNGMVDVLYQAPGMMVTGTGKALQDGATGHAVRIMNTDSGRIVSGEVLADGRILVK